ncbi:hypothetical protein G6M26_22970 [Agrobacterium tumefaciens]|nr:hypothetical protein [Agrobacterium tumefaciens]NTE21404.1 hypothetical protein [Agrobacterium tumefaciens]
MKKVFILIAISLSLAACNSKQKKDSSNHEQDTSMTSTEQNQQKSPIVAGDSIVWDKVPELKNIGKFPFFAPTGELVMADAKDGSSEIFDYVVFNNYIGSGIYPTKGKLGILAFEDHQGKPFNKLLFDDTFDEWIEKSGAPMIYEGTFPPNEEAKKKLHENMFSGKKRTLGLADDEPFAMYVFKNEGKKYIIHVQSNSAQGKVFVMELK